MRSEDERWMAVALRVARLASPAPNPPVGAVLVGDGRLISMGWHERAGGPHAEIVALGAAGRKARGATLYVTLEPCNHHGRTPPCVEAILAAGVARVVVGCRDPNPQVLGFGASRLSRNGVAVSIGVQSAAATRIIARWADSLISQKI